MPITWKNIDAPDFKNSMWGTALAGASFDKAGDSLTGLLDKHNTIQEGNWTNQAGINTDILLARAKEARDLNAFNAQKGNYDPAALMPEMGRQFDKTQLQAGLKDQEKLLLDAAYNAAAPGAMQVMQATNSPGQAGMDLQQRLIAAGMDPQARAGFGTTFQQNDLSHAEALLKEKRDQDLVRRMQGEQNPQPQGQAQQSIETGSGSPLVGDGRGVFGDQLMKESGGRDFDANGDILRSPKGAMGRNQVLRSTALDPGLPGVRPADPKILDGPDKHAAVAEYNRVGDEYMDALRVMFNGDEKLAQAAYNAGPNAVKRAGGVPNFAETQNYVKGVPGSDRIEPNLMTPEMLEKSQSWQDKNTTRDRQTLLHNQAQYTHAQNKAIEAGVKELVAERIRTENPNLLTDSVKNSPHAAAILKQANIDTTSIATLDSATQSNLDTDTATADYNLTLLENKYAEVEAAYAKNVESFKGGVVDDVVMEEIAKHPEGIAGVFAKGVSQPGIIVDALHTNDFADDVNEGIAEMHNRFTDGNVDSLTASQYVATAVKMAGASRTDSAGKKSIKLDVIKENLPKAIAKVDAYNTARAKQVGLQNEKKKSMLEQTMLANRHKNAATQSAVAGKLGSRPYVPSTAIEENKATIQGLVDILVKKHQKNNPGAAPLASEAALKVAEEILKANPGINPSEMYNSPFPVI